MTAYMGDGELICEHCAVDMTDDDVVFDENGSDSPSHCAYCHSPLLDDVGLSAEGVKYVLETVRRDLKAGTSDTGWRWTHGFYLGMGRNAVCREWAEHVLSAFRFSLSKRDRRTLELYLHFTAWEADLPAMEAPCAVQSPETARFDGSAVEKSPA
jgi:hypothetical protein